MNNRWTLNRQHWEQTLDAQNLGRSGTAVSTERQAALYNTADIRYALDGMEPLRGNTVLDVGGGLALAAILLARRGARVVVADISQPRVQAARQTLRQLGLDGQVELVVARAEEMPFRDAAFSRIMSKAVLIHTDLTPTMRELHRILDREGRLFILEPTRGNPFVNLYRKLLAPKMWAHITSYFGPEEDRVIRATLPRTRRLEVRHFFLLGFFASFFEFALPSPALYRLSEALLGAVDGILFRLFSPLRSRAWFIVYRIGSDDGSA